MLIIPAIHVRNGESMFPVKGEAGEDAGYPVDPLALIRMWRGENAKALHIIDHDSGTGTALPRSIIARMVTSVDIQLQFQPVSYSEADVADFCEHCGLYRLALPVHGEREAGIVKNSLSALGPSRIVAVLEARIAADTGITEVERLAGILQDLSKHGLRRWIYAAGGNSRNLSEALTVIRSIAARITVATTLHGFVTSYSDLRTAQLSGVRQFDSLILDDPLFNNAFPCQAIWRHAERRLKERGEFP